MPPAPAFPLAQLVQACRAVPPRCAATRVIAVDGRSGAGKSRLAEQLAEGLARPSGTGERCRQRVQVVRMDDVYPGWDGLRDAAVLLCRWLFRPLAAGRPAGYYRYDWSAGRFGAWQPVEPGGVLVLEGVGSGAARLAARLSLLVWVEAPPEIRRQRALERDGETFAAHWDRWAAQEERYLAQEAPQLRADLTVPT